MLQQALGEGIRLYRRLRCVPYRGFNGQEVHTGFDKPFHEHLLGHQSLPMTCGDQKSFSSQFPAFLCHKALPGFIWGSRPVLLIPKRIHGTGGDSNEKWGGAEHLRELEVQKTLSLFKVFFKTFPPDPETQNAIGPLPNHINERVPYH